MNNCTAVWMYEAWICYICKYKDFSQTLWQYYKLLTYFTKGNLLNLFKRCANANADIKVPSALNREMSEVPFSRLGLGQNIASCASSTARSSVWCLPSWSIRFHFTRLFFEQSDVSHKQQYECRGRMYEEQISPLSVFIFQPPFFVVVVCFCFL